MVYANISNDLNVVQTLKEKQIFQFGSQKRVTARWDTEKKNSRLLNTLMILFNFPNGCLLLFFKRINLTKRPLAFIGFMYLRNIKENL